MGEKQIYKNLLIQMLGYNPKRYTVKRKIQTIATIILYLTELGVKDIGKVVTRRPQVLEHNVKSYIQPRVNWLKNKAQKTYSGICIIPH